MVSRLKSYGDAVSVATLTPSTYSFTEVTPTLSDALTDADMTPDTVAPALGLVIETVGAVESLTVTLNDFVAVLPLVSEAEQLTVVVPVGNVEPEAGLHVTGREPSTKSVAVTANDTTAPEELVASAVIVDG